VTLPARRCAAGLLVMLAASLYPESFASANAPPEAPSITEFLRLDCASTLGRREVTLFDHGTVRLREGPPGKEEVGLRELGPDELTALVRRLAEIDLAEVVRLPKGVEGEWVERCRLDLALPDRPRRRFEFGRYDSLPLPLGQVLRVTDDLAAGLSARPPSQLPAGYRPQRGDLLRRVDGAVYRVVGLTTDGKAVELTGMDQPLTLYVQRDALRQEFVELLPPYRGPLGPP
jgi:hypothetical protein